MFGLVLLWKILYDITRTGKRMSIDGICPGFVRMIVDWKKEVSGDKRESKAFEQAAGRSGWDDDRSLIYAGMVYSVPDGNF